MKGIQVAIDPDLTAPWLMLPRERCGRCDVELTEYLPAYYAGMGQVCMACDREIRLAVYPIVPMRPRSVLETLTQEIR